MKQILHKIRALFKINGKEKEMNLSSAEIKPGMIFLHPEDDPAHTFCVKSDVIDILINPFGEITDDDIVVLDNIEKKNHKTEPVPTVSADTPKVKKNEASKKESIVIRPEKEAKKSGDKPPLKKTASEKKEPELHSNGVADWPGYRKRKISFSIYEDEYELLLEHLQSNGYKRAEFFFACIHAAKKNSMDAVYKQIEADHKKGEQKTGLYPRLQ